MGSIELAKMKQFSPKLFAPKKTVSSRFCVDQRKLDPGIVFGFYSIPGMDERVDQFSDTLVCSILQPNRGFWQVQIDDLDCDKTAFTSDHWMLRFSRTPFGLFNAPSKIQKTMDVKLGPVKRHFALVYLHYIFTFSRNANAKNGMFVMYCHSYTNLASHLILRSATPSPNH